MTVVMKGRGVIVSLTRPRGVNNKSMYARVCVHVI